MSKKRARDKLKKILSINPAKWNKNVNPVVE
jgi:hypothetical protein